MLKALLEGGALPVTLIVAGLFFTFYLRGYPMRSPRRCFGAMVAGGSADRRGKRTSPFRAVTLALAGTLGVGNIVGVANALWIGGAGAIFWMWISALFAMVLKYAEILLAVSHRRQGRDGRFFGGAVYYIRDFFASRRMEKIGGVIAAVFSLLMILDALSMGCVIQVNAISMALSGIWKVPLWLCGGALLLFALPVMVKGSHKISALTELLVPIMSLGYVVLSVAVLIIKWDAVGDAFISIFKDAFSVKGATGGIFGFLTAQAIRTGTMRGLLSNEAGCGTAPTAHAAADAHSPAAQGVWGIFEVFVDTILLCSATALVILVSWGEVEMLGSDPVMMTVRAYSSVLGDWSAYFLGAAIFCFGYATVICWGNYGLESLSALTPSKRWKAFYFAAVAICIALGAVAPPDALWSVSDFAIASLTTINLCMLFLMRREIKYQTFSFFER